MNNRQANDGSFPKDASKKEPSRYATINTAPGEGLFSWADVDSELLRNTVTCVTDGGDAISFAVNRNRTSGSITVLSGSERPRFYVQDVDAAERTLREIIKAALK